MSSVDGSIILAKGSVPNSNPFEYLSRRFDMQITSDGNSLYINYVREISASITTGAILKLDSNLDLVNNYYLKETIGGVSHDFTSIALGNNEMVYIGGNVEESGRVNALIMKLKDASSSVIE